MSCVIAIETRDPLREREARVFAERERMPVRNAPSGSIADDRPRLLLVMRDDGWELREGAIRPGRGMRIDFTHLAQRSRGAGNFSRRQPLAHAVGRESRRIIDATAGLGSDASLLAAMGFEVTAVERNPILAMLLRDAKRRAEADPAASKLLGNRLRIVEGDARVLLTDRAFAADCVYIDPMFPPKRKASALAKKEIRLVRALVGHDDDAGELLEVARRSARRVAVKRPTHAPPLAADVTATIESKLVRYDIYVRPDPDDA